MISTWGETYGSGSAIVRLLSLQDPPSQIPVRLEDRMIVPAPGLGTVSLGQIESGDQHLVPRVVGRGGESAVRLDDGGVAVARHHPFPWGCSPMLQKIE